jgi:hypothetical protein
MQPALYVAVAPHEIKSNDHLSLIAGNVDCVRKKTSSRGSNG